MKLRAFLNVGHTGRHNQIGYNVDRGAHCTPVGDEVSMVWEYVNEARKVIDQAGHSAVVQSWGAYREQQQHAEVVAKSYDEDRCVWVGCHLNAGPGRYGLVLFDQRSIRGRDYATAVSGRLRASLPRDAVPDVKTVGTEVNDQWGNARSIITGLYAGPANICGLVYEPVFLSEPTHHQFLTAEGLKNIGRALANGLLDAFTQETS